MHHLRLIPLWFVLLVLVLACRRDGATDTPDNFSARLPDQLLGAPAELAFFIDGTAIRRDSVYGPVLAHRSPGTLSDDRDLRWLDRNIDRIDVWVLGLGGSSRDITGLAVLRSGRVRESDFGPFGLRVPTQRRLDLPTGAVMFVIESHGLQSAMFLVDGHLVLAAGAAIAPTQLHFSTSRTLPPELDAGSGALAGAYGRRPALDGLGSDPWDHATAASIVWSTGRKGDILATATFDNDESADKAQDWAEELPEVKSEYRRKCPPLADLKVLPDRSGRTVTVRVTGLRDVLAAAMQDRLCK